MKKLVILSSGIAIVLLCSFGFQKMEIRKKATNLYEVTSLKRVSAEDKEQLKQTLVQHYNIKNMTGMPHVSKNDPANKGGWIFESSCISNVASTHFITWKNVKPDAEGEKVQGILAKYAGGGKATGM